MIGQEALTKIIEEATLDTLPHSILLVGERGCGKHLFCKQLAEHLHLEIEVISEKFSYERLQDISLYPKPVLYAVEVDNLLEKDQNTLLKMAEEPLSNMYMVFLTSSINYIIETLKNRCRVITFASYSTEALSQFLSNSNRTDVLEIATTPGQVMEIEHTNLTSLVELADKIVTKIEVASIANTLTIVDRLAFKDEKDKLDVKIFLRVLLNRYKDAVVKDKDLKYSDGYCLTRTLLESVDRYKNLDKKMLVANYLTTLWRTMRSRS